MGLGARRGPRTRDSLSPWRRICHRLHQYSSLAGGAFVAGGQGARAGNRLSPRAAVDDSVAAYRWMLAQGLKASRIAVSGDSAGGGLTAATLVAIRDAKLPLPAAGALLSPWVDMEGIGESMTSKDSVDPMVHKDGLL